MFRNNTRATWLVWGQIRVYFKFSEEKNNKMKEKMQEEAPNCMRAKQCRDRTVSTLTKSFKTGYQMI